MMTRSVISYSDQPARTPMQDSEQGAAAVTSRVHLAHVWAVMLSRFGLTSLKKDSALLRDRQDAATGNVSYQLFKFMSAPALLYVRASVSLGVKYRAFTTFHNVLMSHNRGKCKGSVK